MHACGLPTDELLNHGSPRLVYGVELTENVGHYLLGIDKRAKYILGQKNLRHLTQQIGTWWVKRWVLKRIAREEVLGRVAGHNFIHPISHGARVELPKDEFDTVARSGR